MEAIARRTDVYRLTLYYQFNSHPRRGHIAEEILKRIAVL